MDGSGFRVLQTVWNRLASHHVAVLNNDHALHHLAMHRSDPLHANLINRDECVAAVRDRIRALAGARIIIDSESFPAGVYV
jgi:hypothetical protein